MLKPDPCTKYCLPINLLLRLSINAEYDFRPNLIANKFTKMLNVKVDITQTYIIDGSTNRWTRLYIGLGYHKICI